jgi:hypothetical protein
MNYETLQSNLLTSTNRIVSIRESYAQQLQKTVAEKGSESNLPFNSSGMYESWINYSPYFFRELAVPYLELVSQGHTPEDLAPLMENKFRVVRYFTQILLPGIYLDQTVPTSEKLFFLNHFSQTMEKTLNRKGYDEPGYDRLFSIFHIGETKKMSVSYLIGALKEACELIYFGEQPIGFPSFGIDKDIMPDQFTLYQSFDLNKGVRKFPKIQRMNSITIYPQDAIPRFTILMDRTHAQIFLHKYQGTQEWISGLPHISNLSGAGMFIEGQQMREDEISRTTEQLRGIMKTLRQQREVALQSENNIEYCDVQSGVIRNLNQALNKNWNLPDDAQETIRNNDIALRLKGEWGLRYNFEVAVALIKKSIDWAKDASK